MTRLPALFLAALLYAPLGNAVGADLLPNDPRHSPFAYIGAVLAGDPGTPECYINEGYLNFLEDWYLDPKVVPTAQGGTSNIKRWPYPKGDQAGSPDVTRTLLTGLNALPGAGANIHVAVAAPDCDGCGAKAPILRQVLPKAELRTDLAEFTTHGKTVQCTNGRVYLTQNGSTNLQTVGVTTKANNSLVFVETAVAGEPPRMYRQFRDLWQAVVQDSGSVFPGGGRDSSGLSGMTTPVELGGRPVSFYAGRRNAFVGPSWNDGGLSIPFPDNLHPPTAGELPGDDLGTVNWYDQVILDAGQRLVAGEAVTVDVFMFEVGSSNPFVDNLARLVEHGFVDCPVFACPRYFSRRPVAISKKPGAPVPATAFPGQLTVNFHYQFQSGCQKSTRCRNRTFETLNQPVAGGQPNYRMNVVKVWQGFTESRMKGNPQQPFTPQDMHLKVVVLTAGAQARLYVATSNLDQPNVGSGRKWQAGNTVDLRADDPLLQLYRRELDRIAGDGFLSQRKLGFANAVNNSYFDPGLAPGGGTPTRDGIAAFLFPLNLTAAAP